MSRITLGLDGQRPIVLDLDAMLRTRLLVQGNSGAGKSWLLRRLAEQLFGKVPVLILDPEGEFATLRERYGYVLVGKGGETPADTRSAALVAHKLLELRASAVCDLYEVKPADRHRWVRLFLEALVDAPKKLWHPTVVIVDEAHLFCPEKGTGESEALEAMIDLATRGRKRGLCAVFATQRLGKLRKDAAAELLNVLIGSTFIDVDRERAADALGIARGDKGAFFEEIRLLGPGFFWGLGRAVSLERVLVKVGPVETSHPESGSAKHAAEPPPPPEKVQALLPKLVDLPKQAEEKARTEAELRAEILRLKGEVRAALQAQPAPAPPKRVEVPVLKAEQIKRLEAASAEVRQGAAAVETAKANFYTAVEKCYGIADGLLAAMRPLTEPPTITHTVVLPAVPPRPVIAPAAGPQDPEMGRGGLRRMCVALAQRHPLTAEQLGLRAGLSSRSGTFDTYLGRGRQRGWIDGTRDRLTITAAGVEALGTFEPLPAGRALLDYWLSDLGASGASRMLRVLADAYPQALNAAELGSKAGISSESGTFDTYLGRLRRLELVQGNRESLRASAEFFE